MCLSVLTVNRHTDQTSEAALKTDCFLNNKVDDNNSMYRIQCHYIDSGRTSITTLIPA